MAGSIDPSREADRRRAVALLSQGEDLFKAGRFEEAVVALRQSLGLWQALRERDGELGARFLLGATLGVLARPREAEDVLRGASDLARELGDPEAESMIAASLGQALLAAGDAASARRHFEALLDRARRLHDPEQEHAALTGLGVAFVRLGRLEEAYAVLTQSLDLARRAEEPAAMFKSLLVLGLCLKQQGEYPRAVDTYEWAADLARRQGEPGDEAQALTHLGTVLHHLGDFRHSIAAHQRAHEILRRLGDQFGEAGVLSEMSRPYLGAGEPEQARECNERALAIARSTGDLVVQGSALAHLAQIAFMSGDHRLALEHLTASLELKKKSGDRQGTAATLSSMSAAHLALGSHDEALARADEALRLARTLGSPEDLGGALLTVGLVRFRCGDPPGAETVLRESLELLESLHKDLGEEDKWQISLADRQFVIYRLLQEVLAAQGKLGPGLEIAERGRARAVARLMAKHLSASQEPEAPRLADLQRTARELDATLVEYTVLVDPLTAVLGPAAESGDLALLIWVIRPDGEMAVRRTRLTVQEPSPGGEQEPVRLRDMVYVPGPRRGSDPWKMGYRGLIQPIESLLPSARGAQLVLILQDLLFLMPWAALEDGAGTPLIERYSLSLAPSIQTLDLARRRKTQLVNAGGEALVVGDPEFGGSLPHLPGAADEALTVARLLGTRPLLGAEATKAAVLERMPGSRILHFATHGLLGDVEKQDVPGAIALTPSSGDKKGLLTAAEIMSLSLKAELAVLSACRTGDGRPSSDSIVGLSRAFLAAGVPSLIVSLWSIPDLSTSLLMKELYRALAQGLGKAQALREAMLATRRLQPDPLHWAGFALLGEGS